MKNNKLRHAFKFFLERNYKGKTPMHYFDAIDRYFPSELLSKYLGQNTLIFDIDDPDNIDSLLENLYADKVFIEDESHRHDVRIYALKAYKRFLCSDFLGTILSKKH